MNATQASHNFSTLKTLLLASAPTQKAAAAVNLFCGQVEARGGEWMASNACELNILSPYGDADTDSHNPAPVADNRLFFIAKLQTALRRA